MNTQLRGKTDAESLMSCFKKTLSFGIYRNSWILCFSFALLNPIGSYLNSGHPDCTSPPPAVLDTGGATPSLPQCYCSLDDKAHVPPYSASWWGVGGLFVWLPLSQTHARIWRTHVLSKEKGSGGGGATTGHYSGGGGGEKTRRAGHLWCMSVICSDRGLHTHTLLRFKKNPSLLSRHAVLWPWCLLRWRPFCFWWVLSCFKVGSEKRKCLCQGANMDAGKLRKKVTVRMSSIPSAVSQSDHCWGAVF